MVNPTRYDDPMMGSFIKINLKLILVWTFHDLHKIKRRKLLLETISVFWIVN